MAKGGDNLTVAPTLADKLNSLIQERWAGGKVPGNAVVAKSIRDETGLSISTGYLWMLRTGARSNPTGPRLRALAKFFNRPPAYFFDDGTSTSTTDIDSELAAALQSEDIVMIALRSNGLSTRSKRAVLSMIEQAREVERLDAE